MESDNVVANEEEIQTTELSPRSFGEVWKDWLLASLKYIGKKIHSPLGIYLVSTWFISFIIMGLTNTFQGGSFFEGPSYWMNTFLTYGLSNDQPTDLRLISKPFIVWFMAPTAVLLMGFTLFMLTDSGFFRNGALPQEEGDFLFAGKFFSEDNIWGSEYINIENPKWTKTYIWLVLMPIILGAVVAATYNFIMFKMIKKTKFLPSTKSFLIIIALFSLVIGIEKALVTGDIMINFKETFYSLFVDRRLNEFLTYTGQYHPIGLAITMWLLYLVPFFLTYLVFLIIGNFDNIWKNRNFLYRRVSEFINARKEPVMDFEESE